MRRPVVAFMPAHPSQVWVLAPVAREAAGFADILWIVRDKDKSSRIASLLGFSPVAIPGSAGGLSGTGLEFLLNTFRCLRLTLSLGIDLWVTKYGCGNIAGRLLGRRSLSFNDDDADQVPVIAATSYPFADMILAPVRTRMGRHERKTTHYNSFHELFYLHPNRFTPDPSVFAELGLERGEPFVIVRRCLLRAHHDTGISGIDDELMDRIVSTVGDRARIFVSSEDRLDEGVAPARLPLREDRIHHALAFASVVISGGQTVAAEAAELGSPAIHVNSFAHRLSYLSELEELGLLVSCKPDQRDLVIQRLDEFLSEPQGEQGRKTRRDMLLNRKIDPVPGFVEAVRGLLPS